MSLALVPRSARALAEHLNHYFRVLKGVDQDSVWLRLPSGGGSFEVRNSVTNAALFRVTDAGATLTGAVSLPADSVSSANIVDGTIEGRDIKDATIPSSKLITGVAITPESITNTEIQDGTIRSFELQDGAVTMPKIAARAATNVQGVGGGTGGTTNATGFVDFDASMVVNYASSGGILLVSFLATVTTQQAADIVTCGIWIAGNDIPGTSYQPAANQHRGAVTAMAWLQPAPGTISIKPRWKHSTSARSAQSVPGEATMFIMEYKR